MNDNIEQSKTVNKSSSIFGYVTLILLCVFTIAMVVMCAVPMCITADGVYCVYQLVGVKNVGSLSAIAVSMIAFAVYTLLFAIIGVSKKTMACVLYAPMYHAQIVLAVLLIVKGALIIVPVAMIVVAAAFLIASLSLEVVEFLTKKKFAECYFAEIYSMLREEWWQVLLMLLMSTVLILCGVLPVLLN